MKYYDPNPINRLYQFETREQKEEKDMQNFNNNKFINFRLAQQDKKMK